MLTRIGTRLAELSKESLAYGLGNVLNRGLLFLLLPIYARALTPDQYGTVDVVSAVGAVLSIVLSAGMTDAEFRYWFDTKDAGDQKVTLSTALACRIVLALVAFVLMVLTGGTLSRAVLGGADQSYLLVLLGAGLLFDPLIILVGNQYRRLRRPGPFIAFTLGQVLLTAGLTIYLVAGLRRGPQGYFEATLASKVALAAVALPLVHRWIGARVSWQRLRELLQYGLPLVPEGLAAWSLALIDRLLLEHYRGLEEVGLYGVGSRIAMLSGLLPAAFAQAWSPFAMSLFREPEAGEVYSAALTLYVAVTAGAALFVSLFGGELLRVLATPSYYAAVAVIPWIAFARIADGMYYIAATGVGLAKRVWTIALTTGLAALLNIGLNLLLIPSLGLVGAAAATLVAQAVSVCGLFMLAQKFWPIPYAWRNLLVGLGCAAAALGVGRGLRPGGDGVDLLWRAFAFALFWILLVLTRVVSLPLVGQVVGRIKSAARGGTA